MKVENIRDTSLVGEIVAAIADQEEVDIDVLAQKLRRPLNREFRIAFSQANSVLHARGGGFIPKPGRKRGGLYVVATTQQKIGRAQHFRQASAKKLARQYVSLAAADPKQLPEVERSAFEASVEKNGLLASRAISLITSKKELPDPSKQFSYPELPRGKKR